MPGLGNEEKTRMFFAGIMCQKGGRASCGDCRSSCHPKKLMQDTSTLNALISLERKSLPREEVQQAFRNNGTTARRRSAAVPSSAPLEEERVA